MRKPPGNRQKNLQKRSLRKLKKRQLKKLLKKNLQKKPVNRLQKIFSKSQQMR